MGVYNYVDQQTGRAYNFTIKGDAPSDTEFARINQLLNKDRADIRSQLVEQFGEDRIAEFDDGTALGRGFARGKKQFKEAIGETIGTIGEETGFDFLKNYGLGVEENARQELNELLLQQPKRMQSTDVTGLSSGLTYAGEVLGEQIPQLGAGLGAAATTAVLAPTAPFIAGAAAAGVATAPILFGNNIQRQEDQVAAGELDSVDVGAALRATFGQAALEGISDKILLGGVLRPLGKSIFTRTGVRAGTGAASESLTEVGQQMLERAQAGLPIDSEDAIAEYREAAIAGGLVGGGTRTTIGAVGDVFATPTTTTTTTTTTTQPETQGELFPDQDLGQRPVADDTTTETTEQTEQTQQPEQLELNLNTVTNEMLTEAGVMKAAPLRKRVVGKDLSDPEVQKDLRKYAKNSQVKKKVPDIGDRIERLLTGTGATANVTGVGGGTTDSQPSVAGSGRTGSGVESTTEPVSSNDGAVGDSVSTTDDTTGTTSAEPDTLTAQQVFDKEMAEIRARNKSMMDGIDEITAEEEAKIAALQKATEQQTATPVTETSVADPPNLRAPLVPQPTLKLEPGMDVTPTGQVIPAGVEVTPPAPVAPDTARADAVKKVVEDENTAAQQELQQKLDDKFYLTQPKTKVGQLSKDEVQVARKFAETEAMSGEPDTTTVADKQAVLKLLDTPNKNKEQKAANIFFQKMRRPADALAAIGAASISQPRQSYAREDVTSDAEYLFYKDQTRGNGRLAATWVRNNMSPEAQAIVSENIAIYGRDPQSKATSERIDAQIERRRAETRIQAEPKQTPNKIAQEFQLKTIKGDDTREAALRRRDGFFLENPVASLDLRLLPSMINALENNQLGVVLRSLAATNPVKRVRQIAAKLEKSVGNTQVQVVDSLEPILGREGAGLFDPSANTIYINRNTGMNTHTVLHEMTHAVTAASIANKSLPTTKQLENVFKVVREQIGEVYGTRDLDEFVAEALSNPQFQTTLALTKTNKGNTTLWNKFTDAMRQLVRRVLGLPRSSALTEVDSIIDGMIAPAPDYRDAQELYLIAATKSGAGKLLSSVANVVPESTASTVADYADIAFNENVNPKVKNALLSLAPANILSDIAKAKIPFAPELNLLINEMSGTLRNKTDLLNSLSRDLFDWQKANPDQMKVLNNLVPRSTFLRVDPSVDVSTYSNDRQRTAEHAQLLELYNQLDDKGKTLYQQMRNYFQDTYNDVIKALETRLELTMPDAATRTSAMQKLTETLRSQGGIIRPYFPLTRKGKYRLAYTAPDPATGQPEAFVEYYPTLRKAQQARDKVSELGGSDTEVSDASKPMDLQRTPPPKFVQDVLNTVALRESSFDSKESYQEAMQALVDLALDAMPERSFMQSFRRRGDVRGFIGDTTPTGMGGIEFDSYTMLKEKGRDLNRQLVQMQFAAKLEGFRKKLAEPRAEGSKQSYLTDPETSAMAAKMDQIARFAQSPNIPRWSQMTNSLGFAYTMGLNFSSAFITFFDVAMSSMPVLAGKYGTSNVTRAYADAAKLFAKAPKTRTAMVPGADGTLTPQEINMGYSGKSGANYGDDLPANFKAEGLDIAIEMATSQGQFNQSFTQEALEVGRDAPLETFNRFMSFMFHHSERFNREATFIAAYLASARKARQDGKTLDGDLIRELSQQAINDTEFTLGGTAAAGRPTVAQTGIGNILFLFKRFAISKYYMMYRLAQDAMKNMNPQERRAAQKGLAGFMGMTGLMAGLGGMPLMGIFGAMYNMFADEDEDDFEAATRKLVGEGVYGGLANQVLGADVANRISMNSLLYRKPIIDKDQSNLWTLIEQLGGPVVGVGLSVERGIKDVFDGEVYRGIESMVPASMRNGMKTIRFINEGATTRRGDPITEEINPYNLVMQALGFAPQSYIQALEFNKNNRRRQEAINSRRTKLLRKRNMAKREGDFEEVAEIDRAIMEFNQSLPRGAEKSIITSDTKRRSAASFGRTTDKMRGGMTYTPFMEKSLREYDQGFNLF